MATGLHVLVFVAGLVLLCMGAKALVRGAVRLARTVGASPFVIGMTVVAFGTSVPELSLDLTAAFRGEVDLAFGDLVGSNIANIGLILGTAAVIRPLKIQMRLLRVEVPIVIAASLGLWGLGADGHVGRLDGLIMLCGFMILMANMYRSASREPPQVKAEFEHQAANHSRRFLSVLLVLAGLAGLIVGAQLMVFAATAMAREFGVSEVVIGLTIVAIGTSLPELATTSVAAFRGEADIAVGNVLGSNVFNLLFVMALVAQVQPLPVHRPSLMIDVPVMIGFAAALVPIMLRGLVVSRWEGTFLLVAYGGFLAWQGFQPSSASGAP